MTRRFRPLSPRYQRPYRTAAYTALAMAAIALAAAPMAPAQVPDGYLVASSIQKPGSVYPGIGGMYLVHPRRPGNLLPVQNLPPALTGELVAGSNQGANCVVLLPDGDLVVGTAAPAGSPVELYRLRLLPGGTAVAALIITIELGVAGIGGGGVAQLAVVSPEEVLVVGNNVNPMPSLGPPAMRMARVALDTGVVSPVPLVFGGSGSVQGLTYDAATATVYLATHNTAVPPRTQFHAFSLATPGEAQQIASTQGVVTNLAWRPAGGPTGAAWTGALYATFNPGSPSLDVLRRIDPISGAVTGLQNGWDELAALAVEPATGELALCGIQLTANPETGGVHWFETTTRTLRSLANWPMGSMSRGPFTGIAAAAAPATYGQASGPSPTFQWSLTSQPARLPLAGNPLFFVDVAWPSGVQPLASVWLMGSSPIQLPFPPLGITLLVNPIVSGPMLLDATPGAQRSVLQLPLPASLRQACCLQLQSAHLVGGALHATDGLRVPIL